MLVVASAALVVVLIVGALLALGDDEPSLTFGGQPIAQAEETLIEAEENLQALVEDRHGASNDESRCYFSLPDGDTSDVDDHLRCGPVLFVDGDPDKVYLTFPLEERRGTDEDDTDDNAEGDEGDGDAVRLVPAAQPENPEPSRLDQGEVLRRPDGQTPPDGAGGLEAPLPQRAEAGFLAVNPLDGVELEDPGPNAVIGAYNQAYRLIGMAQPDRFGRGDAARRPAEGERFVAAQIQLAPGEVPSPGASAAPEVSIQIDEDAPVPAPEAIAAALEPVGLIVSVPEDAERVDLVVTELGIEQRLSLVDGEPGADNLSVLRRQNRSQQLNARADLVFTASAPGRISSNFSVSVSVPAVRLYWFLGADGSQHPAGPDRAYLVPDTAFVWDPALNLGPNSSLDPRAFTLALPDGTVVPATNLAPAGEVLVAFDVPADFTTGTLTVGGRYTDSSTVTVDFGASRLQVPIDIPAG